MSLEKCIQYYLKLSSRKFPQHPCFTLVAFDMISKKRALNSAYFKLNLSESDIKKDPDR